MSRLWNLKDESQYQYLKRLELERGRSGREAAEFAALAVSDRLRLEGRVPNRATNQARISKDLLNDRTLAELRNMACNLNINIRRRMSRADLINAIRTRRKLGVLPPRRTPDPQGYTRSEG